MKHIVGVLAICALASSTAADSSEDKAGAEALFNEGRTLLQAGKAMEACPKFEASLRLDRAVGTELNLGDCYERLGRYASAWGMFRQAADDARRLNNVDAEQAANERARALEPKLSRLTIQSPKEAIAGVVVTRNGVVIDAALLGTPIPVDSGPHRIQCRAPGRKDWTQDLEIKIGETMVTAVPNLMVDATQVAPGTSTTGEAQLQIVVGERGEEYEIELATTAGLLKCDGKVTRDKPCKLKAPTGPAAMTLRGTASIEEEFDFSGKPVLITVAKRDRFWRTTGLLAGVGGIVVAGVGLYACSQQDSESSTAGTICLGGTMVGGVAIVAGGAMVVYDLVAAKHEIVVRTDADPEVQPDGGATWGARPARKRSPFASPITGGAVFGLTGRF